tara:strand:+ start:1939 stop:3021 length:1083 start_codon:yes stop_codon:yes gene_type:complete
MATEKFFVHKEDGSLVRIKGRLVRFLDNEAPTGSDKSAIRTSLEVSPDAEGLVQADVGTAPNEIPVNGMLGDLAYQSSDSVSVGTLMADGKTTLTNDSDNALVVETTNKNPMYVNVVGSAPNYLFDVRDDGTSKVRVDGSGNVTVNGGRLEVQKTGGDAIFSLNRTDAKQYNFYVDSASDLNVRDQSAGSTRLKITGSGDVNVGAGNLVIGTSGKGIDFGSVATSAGDGTGTTGTVESSVLDDYESGYLYPNITMSSSGTVTRNGTYNTCRYTKVGNRVFVTGLVIIDSVSSPVGLMQLQLPFLIKNEITNAFGGAMQISNGSTHSTAPYFGTPNNAYISISATPSANDQLRFDFSYVTA